MNDSEFDKVMEGAAPSAHSARHGIERLRWLEEPDPDLRPYGMAASYPRLLVMSAQAVNVEVAYALIEELHDALESYHARRHAIVFDPSSSEELNKAR